MSTKDAGSQGEGHGHADLTVPRAGARARVFAIVAAGVFLSRVPFLEPGYGYDPDAWRIALSARRLAVEGKYEVSRFPGYPVPELVSALFVWGGPLALNGLAALLSAVAAAFFALTLKALGSRDYVPGALAVAFAPVVYINSTCSMDYVWALAFLLASLYFVLGGRPVVAGVLLGLAIGSRATSAAMLVPLSVLVVWPRGGRHPSARRPLHGVVKLWAASCLVGGGTFLPVYVAYGFGFLRAHAPKVYPPAAVVVYKATFGTLGVVGMAGLAGAAASVAVAGPRRAAGHSSLASVGAPPLVWASVLAIGLHGVVFVALPEAAGYLIPAVPFVLLLLARVAPRRAFVVACLSLIVSPFVLGIAKPSGELGPAFSRAAVRFHVGKRRLVLDPLKGPILLDHSTRRRRLDFVVRALDHLQGLSGNWVVVAGMWLPLMEMTGEGNADLQKVTYTLDGPALQRHLDARARIYYLPDLRGYNIERHGIDLREHGGTPLFESDEH